MLTGLRRALRSLLRTPGFTLVAVLTLALGIGATTAIFSAADALLFRALPYPAADRLVMLWVDGRKLGFAQQDYTNPTDLADWEAKLSTIEALGGFTGWAPTLTGPGEPERIDGSLVTQRYFDALAVPMQLGRGFHEGEDVPNGPRVVVVSDAFWRRWLGASPTAIGATVQLEGEPYTVVGVLPPSFESPLQPDRHVYRPAQYELGDRGGYFIRVVARLKAGATIEQAQREFSGLHAQLAAAYPETSKGRDGYVQPLREAMTEGVRRQLLVLLGATALVLLIACANIANLLLARASGRARELAVRAALGAGRARIARQLLAESAVLGALGAVFGVALAAVAIRWIGGALPAGVDAAGPPTLDWRVLGFAVSASLAAGLVFGSAPALVASRQDLVTSLREGDRGSAGGRRARRVREVLVVATFALALALTAGAGVFLKSLGRLTTIDPGFRPEGALTFGLRLPPATYATPEANRALHARLRERVGALPGVEHVGLTTTLPLGGSNTDLGVRLDGMAPDAEPLRAWYSMVSPGYLEALGARIVRGRAITDAEAAGGPCRAVVNESFARDYLAGREPLGSRFTVGAQEPIDCEIVGIAGDVRFFGLDQPQTPALYGPLAQFPARQFFVVVRSRGDVGALLAPIRREIAAIDASLALADVQPMTVLVHDALRTPRLVATLTGAFAALALVLAAVGVYGVIAYSVAMRTREFGVRSALGASRRKLVSGVLRRGLALSGLGIAIGVVLSLALGRLVAALLYEVRPGDPGVIAFVSLLLGIVALVACVGPALRASRVDPMVALRQE
ncbi:MAG TPA: ABC transporter permease [Xanthomonadales bacterium]|nr:ABC transporter permease [Xanthomonadales bacterium]